RRGSSLVGEPGAPAAGRSPGRSFSPASRGDHQPSPSAGAAGGGDRLGLSGGTLQLGVSGRTRAAAVADAAGGRAVHSQAYAQPLRRGAVRAMGGETRISSTSVGEWCFRLGCPFIPPP